MAKATTGGRSSNTGKSTRPASGTPTKTTEGKKTPPRQTARPRKG